MASVRPGGRVVLAGIPGDDFIRFGASLARRKGLTIAMVRRMNEVYPRAISLAERGVVDLGSVVTSRSGLGEIPEAFGDASPSHRAQGDHRAPALTAKVCACARSGSR